MPRFFLIHLRTICRRGKCCSLRCSQNLNRYNFPHLLCWWSPCHPCSPGWSGTRWQWLRVCWVSASFILVMVVTGSGGGGKSPNLDVCRIRKLFQMPENVTNSIVAIQQWWSWACLKREWFRTLISFVLECVPPSQVLHSNGWWKLLCFLLFTTMWMNGLWTVKSTGPCKNIKPYWFCKFRNCSFSCIDPGLHKWRILW